MSTTYTVSAQDIVKSALRLTGRFGTGDSISSEDMINVLQALNIVTKSLITVGLPLWTMENVTIPLVAGKAKYSIGTSGADVIANRPTKIQQAFLTNSTGNNTVLNVISRYDYNTLGLPTAQGVPNQIWYDYGIPNGTITLYDVPIDSLSTLTIVSQRQLSDFNTLYDAPDFPQEWYAPLKWILADEIALEYECKPNVLQMINAKATMYREHVSGWGKEDVPVRFVPANRFTMRG